MNRRTRFWSLLRIFRDAGTDCLAYHFEYHHRFIHLLLLQLSRRHVQRIFIQKRNPLNFDFTGLGTNRATDNFVNCIRMKEEKTQAEESLEAFKKRIHKLSYDELYDELDAAEKAESEERIAIVEKRIDELEPIEKKKKEIQEEEEKLKRAIVMWPLGVVFGGAYATKQIAYFLQNKQFGSSDALKTISNLEVLPYIPYVSAVIGILIVYSWSYLRQKKRTLDLGITGFCLSKASAGLLYGSYPGFFITPGAFLSRVIACIVATLSLVFMYNIFTGKHTGRFFDNAWPLLLITVAVEQIGWLEHL